MNLISRRTDLAEFKKRYKWMALFAVLCFSMLTARVLYLQVTTAGQWKARSENNITQTVSIPARRGLVRDTMGRVLATSRIAHNIHLTPQLLKDGDLERFFELAALDDDVRTRVRKKVEKVPLHRRAHQIEVLKDASNKQLAVLQTRALELPAISIHEAPVRVYPHNALGAHLIGYMNEVNAEDIKNHPKRQYRPGEQIGRLGVEKGFEDVLRGRRGKRVFKRKLSGRTSRGKVLAEPVQGKEVVLAIDMELMRIAERAFQGLPTGALAVVDVNSGRVRALFSKPSYDLNDLSTGITGKAYGALVADPFRPLVDKSIYESYFPGSTFKVFTAAAAVEEGVAEPHFRAHCPGYYEIGTERKRCTGAHGDVDFHTSLVRSCNVYFWEVASRLGLEHVNRYARVFGLGDRTGVGINSEASGTLATRAWYEKHFGRYRIGYTLNTAIGQGNTRATTLQLALAYGAIANGGKLYQPLLVERIGEGDEAKRTGVRVRRDITACSEHSKDKNKLPCVTPTTLERIRSALKGVVNDDRGTAHAARIENGVVAAGKTGTAEVAPGGSRRLSGAENFRRRSHAWFAGYAPANDPIIAIAVLVEHGGAGGKAAAPVALRVMNEYLLSKGSARRRGVHGTPEADDGQP